MRTKYRGKNDNQGAGKSRSHAGIWKKRLYKRRHRCDSERQYPVPANGACNISNDTCHRRVTRFSGIKRLPPGRIDVITHVLIHNTGKRAENGLPQGMLNRP
jgi:hypothetical protein